jgi:hypothetical protein
MMPVGPTRVWSVPVLAALVASGVLLLAACDLGSGSAPPPPFCTEAGVQCQLPAGPLGVCERTPCAAGEHEPCFRCVPQH